MNRRPVHIGEGGAYGCPVFLNIWGLGNGRHTFFQLREDLLALGQLRQVADQDEIADRAVESRQDGSLADRLQDHVDNPGSNVFGRGVAVRLSEVGGGGVQRQVGQGPVADVLYLEVDIRQGPFPGHFSDQMDVLRFQEQAGESEQGSASDADAADMLDMRSFNLYERSSRPHAYDNQVFQRSGIFGSEAVGQKFNRSWLSASRIAAGR